MIGNVRRRVVFAGIIGYVAVHSLLGMAGMGFVTNRGPYLLALTMVVVASVAVLLPWSAGAERRVVPAVVAATVLAGVLVVAVLPDGRPGYALWFPSLVPVPLCGLALRGHSVSALLAAAASAVTTLIWAMTSTVGYQDGLYRVVTPTASVVVAVGIATLVRQYRGEVERSHAEQSEAARLSAAAVASQNERASRLSEIDRVASPLLRKLAAGGGVDARTAAESRLVEAALRDGIRGRALMADGIRETLWAARSRGVQVTVLDDAGLSAADPEPPAVTVLRSCAVRVLELLERGTVTVRLARATEGTVVVIDPLPADVASHLPRGTSDIPATRGHDVRVEIEAGDGDVVVRVRAGGAHASGATADQATSHVPPRQPAGSARIGQPSATS